MFCLLLLVPIIIIQLRIQSDISSDSVLCGGYRGGLLSPLPSIPSLTSILLTFFCTLFTKHFSPLASPRDPLRIPRRCTTAIDDRRSQIIINWIGNKIYIYTPRFVCVFRVISVCLLSFSRHSHLWIHSPFSPVQVINLKLTQLFLLSDWSYRQRNN